MKTITRGTVSVPDLVKVRDAFFGSPLITEGIPSFGIR